MHRRAKISAAVASVGAFTFTAFQIAWVMLFPFFAETLGVSVAGIAGAFAIGSFCFLFGAPYWSSRSERIGRAIPFVVGMSGLFLSVLAIAVLLSWRPPHPTTILLLLVGSRVLYGLTASAIVPVSQVLQIDAGPSIPRATHRHSISMNLGRLVALAFAFFTGNASALAGSTGPLLAGAALLAAILAVPSIRKTAPPLSPALSPSFTHGRNLFRNVAIYRSGLGIALFYTCLLEISGTLLAEHLRSRFLFAGTDAATRAAELLLVCALGTVIVQWVGRKWIVASRGGPLLWIALFFFVAGTMVLMASETLGQARGAMLAIAVGTGWLPPLYLARIYRAVPTDGIGKTGRGTRAAQVSVAHAFGFALGGGIAAMAIFFGPIAKFVALAAIAGALLWAAYGSERSSDGNVPEFAR